MYCAVLCHAMLCSAVCSSIRRGLGKTIMSIALIASDFASERSDDLRSKSRRSGFIDSGTDDAAAGEEVKEDNFKEDVSGEFRGGLHGDSSAGTVSSLTSSTTSSASSFSCAQTQQQRPSVFIPHLFSRSRSHRRGTVTVTDTGTERGSSSSSNRSSSNSSGSCGTLIVCPLSLMSQWMEEFRVRVSCRTGGGGGGGGEGGLRVVMYYGADRDRAGVSEGGTGGFTACSMSLSLSLSADVVITSYGVLTSEWRRAIAASSSATSSPRNSNSSGSSSGVRGSQQSGGGLRLLGREWRRVILDEGHTIRNPATDAAQACHMLRAERRWVLSGTPVSVTRLH